MLVISIQRLVKVSSHAIWTYDFVLILLKSLRYPLPKSSETRCVSPNALRRPAVTDGANFQGNELFHVDSSFNGRRAGHSLLLAHVLPPPGTGGSTEVSRSKGLA